MSVSADSATQLIRQVGSSGKNINHLTVSRLPSLELSVIKRGSGIFESSDCTTLLYVACEMRKHDIIETLLECGADPLLPSIKYSVSSWVCCHNDTELLRLFLKYAKDIDS